jgi:GAF domain-containing protein
MAPQVRDVPAVPELPPDATVREAARAIAGAGVPRAVVVTADGERAVVTAADVVRAVADERRLGSTRALTISRPESAVDADVDPATQLEAVLDLTLAVAVGAAARADGVSVIVRAGAVRRVAATSPDLQTVDELQLDLADGPAVVAMSTLETQRVELRPTAPRWPNYHRAALAHGMRRSLCLPLAVDGEVLGTLTLFWRDSGPFAEEAERAAELVAGRAARAIASTGALEALPLEPWSGTDAVEAGEHAAPEVRADDLPSDEPRDEVVTAAQGILRSRKQYSDEEAFATLRDASERTRRPIPDVAREVVELPEYMRPKTN